MYRDIKSNFSKCSWNICLQNEEFFIHATFCSILNWSTHISISPWLQGDESCDWSAFPAGNERASLRGLFKQPVTRLRSCSRTAFHVTSWPVLLTRPTWVILPYPVLNSEVLLACKRMCVQWDIINCVFWDVEGCNSNLLTIIKTIWFATYC